MAYTLGIDIGTYETKGVLVDTDGVIHAHATRAHKMLVPEPGWAEHRPEEDWWGDFTHVSQTLLRESGIDAREIKAVACSAIGPCMLPVDGAGAPLMNGVLYGVDTRAEAEVRELTERIGEGTIIARCGNALTSQSVGPKILWLRRQRPEIFARTAHILTSTSFLVQRLTGEVVIDHYTAANFSPLYDVVKQDWVDDLADDIIALEKLPRLTWSNEIAGHITKSAAEQTGLAEGTPVTTGTIDAAAEAFSVGVDQPGDMMMMYGSTIFIILRAAAQVSDPRIWYAPWLFEGEHASMAGLATSGTLTHWFRDQIARDLPADEAFLVLAQEAASSPPGAKGLLVLPYFSGERTPIHDVHAKGAVFGLNLTHSRGDIYRALIEGIAHGTRHVTDTFAELGQSPKRLLAVGGGTKNALWLQATSDITGIDQVVCKKSTGASYGDAFLAALAVGLVKRRDITVWNPPVKVIKARSIATYEKAYGLFRRLYEQTKDIAAELGER
ncbi:FGGY-family carbohydrate kinase [Ruegeria sp. 2012CJ41-6]|uniref:FGGY-family carbohydrate kinase n=1 Tax=Ruegeria spongiae TaxID=2942209 RepID=A0ABT0Q3B6_9RHOB|nr:FGGY-family carbohydrate kinase [Ruegeria spongiae]MCL6283922.1 FGGY-family carbohydrate kinase [Ruegeria spongiae]